jgi:hypothetical protein
MLGGREEKEKVSLCEGFVPRSKMKEGLTVNSLDVDNVMAVTYHLARTK